MLTLFCSPFQWILMEVFIRETLILIPKVAWIPLSLFGQCFRAALHRRHRAAFLCRRKKPSSVWLLGGLLIRRLVVVLHCVLFRLSALIIIQNPTTRD